MKKIFIFLVAFVLFASTTATAQDIKMTPYEQKREKLATDGLEKIMNTLSTYDKALFALGLKEALEKAEGDFFQELAISENILFKFCDLGEAFQTEANILANSFDIGDSYAGQSLQEWKEIGRWYKQERLKIDKTKTAEDIQRENDRAELLKQHPGIVGIKQRVNKEFIKWATKGEFEKTVAFNERIAKRGTVVFDSLCFVHFNEMFNSELKRKSSKYDADREGIDIKFYYGDEGNEKSYVDAFWSISPEKYQKLGKVDWNETYAIGAFKKDGNIYPAMYHLAWKNNNEFNNNDSWNIYLGEPEPIVISMSEMLNGTPFSENEHIFDYSQYSMNMMTKTDFLRELAKIDKNREYTYYESRAGYITITKLYEIGFPEKTFIISNDILEDIYKTVLGSYFYDVYGEY